MVHNEPMKFSEWLDSLPTSPTPSQAAIKANISRATVLRHADKGTTTAEVLIPIARAYDTNPIDALISFGMLSIEDVRESAAHLVLSEVTNSEILAELNKRVDPDARRVFRGEGMGNVIDLADHVGGTPASPVVPDDEEIRAAEDESLQGKAAAQKRTPPLEEEHP